MTTPIGRFKIKALLGGTVSYRTAHTLVSIVISIGTYTYKLYDFMHFHAIILIVLYACYLNLF